MPNFLYSPRFESNIIIFESFIISLNDITVYTQIGSFEMIWGLTQKRRIDKK
jgi:hypothetical protein